MQKQPQPQWPTLEQLKESFDVVHQMILDLDAEIRIMNERRSALFDQMHEIRGEIRQMEKEA